MRMEEKRGLILNAPGEPRGAYQPRLIGDGTGYRLPGFNKS